MDPRLSTYMERVLDVFVTAGAESVDREVEELEEDEAVLEATIRFPPAYRLEVDMTVSFLKDRPIQRAYSFHFMDGLNATVFRYDNARHHHDLEHFPHHKHDGSSGRIIGCAQPSVRQVRDEVAAYLERR